MTAAPAAFDPTTATIVIVTYNRSHLLTGLLTSITAMDPKPGRIVIIDNASVDDTTDVVESFRDGIGTEIVYRRLDTNTGGSGGFSEGMRTAYDLGAEWIWMMDDDVEVLPDGLARMGFWTPRFKSIQGRRYDYDGSEFYWQYRIAERMGIPIPFAPSGFDTSGYKEMNSGCFEGMFIHRSVVAQIGLPDPRFFIYWDDQMYGWLASRKTTAVIVDEFVLRHPRDQAVGHGHPAHERVEQRLPLLHHAQSRLHQELLPRARRLQPGAVRSGDGDDLREGAHPTGVRGENGPRHQQPVPRPERRRQTRP